MPASGRATCGGRLCRHSMATSATAGEAECGEQTVGVRGRRTPRLPTANKWTASRPFKQTATAQPEKQTNPGLLLRVVAPFGYLMPEILEFYHC